jgi:uncharacterized protein
MPCEVMMWDGLPVIRKEIAISLIQQFGISQRQAAEKLGVTPAAVCQYLAKKRGSTVISDSDIRLEIAAAAQRIHRDDGAVVIETCRICRLCAEKNVFSQKDNGHDG